MLSLPGLLIIGVVVLVLFGRGKVSGLFGEIGKGISSFRREVRGTEPEAEVPRLAVVPATAPVKTTRGG